MPDADQTAMKPTLVKTTLFGFLIIVIVMLGQVFVMRKTPSSLPIDQAAFLEKDGSLNRTLAARLIRSRFAAVGPAQTFTELKSTMKGADFGLEHAVAHVFGELLYDEKGISGITVCDDSFGFGCYHSFFGRAIAKEGPGIIEKLDSACSQAHGPMGLGCPHGIGHGLGEYFGPAKLDEQLSYCGKLTWRGRFFGCKGGVFMEYNFPTVVGVGTATTSNRPFDAQHPYAPCPLVPAEVRDACYLELPAWWQEVLSRDYAKIGVLCGDVIKKEERESCFLGVGVNGAPRLLYEPAAVRETCAKMPSRDGRLLCLSGASWAFFANPAMREKAVSVCELESASDREFCRNHSDLLGSGQ